VQVADNDAVAPGKAEVASPLQRLRAAPDTPEAFRVLQELLA
jgi:hypothetical protein